MQFSNVYIHPILILIVLSMGVIALKAHPLYFVVVILIFTILIIKKRLDDARRVQFIRTFSLPPGIYERLRKHHPHLSLKDCQLVGTGLRDFFLVQLNCTPFLTMMPSQVVDDLWHEFILYTKHYEQFCKLAFGRFIHHTPAAVLGSVANTNSGLRRCWWYACKEELINPREPTRLPLLFSIDAKLNIKDGFRYAINCDYTESRNKNDPAGQVIHCAADFSDKSVDGSLEGFGDGFSGHNGDGDSSGDGGGGCGGGGCGGD